jgi:sugar/nucleoside kinase (ribokinase family)
MRCYPGAANEIESHELNPSLFKGVNLVHIEGYMLYAKDKIFVPEAMRCAKEAGATISFDLSSYDLIRLQKEKIIEILNNYVDIVFANEDEVKELTGQEPLEGCAVLKQICPIAVVMVGPKGCIVGSGEMLHHSSAFPVKALDTTGAGDLFASGFLHAYLNGLPLKVCALIGNMVGGAVCEVYGAEIPKQKWNSLKMQLGCFQQ